MIKYDYEQINKSEFAEGLVMIHYDIDTTENGYKKFEGNIELLIELKHILFKNDVVPDLVGYLSFDNIPNVSICISAQKELGFFISITDGKNIYLTLGDRNTLNETVDILKCTPFVRQYGILLGNGVFFYAKGSTKQTIYTGIQKTGD